MNRRDMLRMIGVTVGAGVIVAGLSMGPALADDQVREAKVTLEVTGMT